MTRMMGMAKDLGNALARTDEYQVLKRTVSDAEGDAGMAELRAELEALEGKIEGALQGGGEPEKSLRESYEEAVGRLQSNPTYQRLVSAQTQLRQGSPQGEPDNPGGNRRGCRESDHPPVVGRPCVTWMISAIGFTRSSTRSSCGW